MGVKKILILDKGQPGEWYGPLRCRRLEKCGRLELLQITNDPPPYWLVMIRNFDMSDSGPDRKALKGLTTPWGNGVWRFLDFKLATAKFEQFSQLPIFIAEEEKRQRRREELAQRIKQVSVPFPSKKNP